MIFNKNCLLNKTIFHCNNSQSHVKWTIAKERLKGFAWVVCRLATKLFWVNFLLAKLFSFNMNKLNTNHATQCRKAILSMDWGHFKVHRKSVDGSCSKLFVVAFYKGQMTFNVWWCWWVNCVGKNLKYIVNNMYFYGCFQCRFLIFI